MFNYGDKAASRLQRFFEIAELTSGRLKDQADVAQLLMEM